MNIKELEKEIRFKVGSEYVNTEILPKENSDFVKKAYDVFKQKNAELFGKIEELGLKVIFTSDDAYKTAKEMRERVLKENVIYIYTEGSEHEYLTPEENWRGRAVHDVFAHLVCGCSFTAQGEYNAYLEQRKHYPAWTWGVLFAEIPAQTSAFYYKGEFTYKQRAFEAPQHWQDAFEVLKTDYRENSILGYDFETEKLYFK
jgi:hypothetical protein